MNELLREIEEDIRRDRMQKLWSRVGRAAVIASVAVVLATVGYVIFKDRAQAFAMRQTNTLMRGIDRLNIEDYRGAVSAFDELAAGGQGQYAVLALLHKARAQTAMGDKDGAQASYAVAAAADEGHFAALAGLLAKKSAAPAKESPFYYSQSEFYGWQLLEQGKKDEAVAAFSALAGDMDAPGSLRERAALALVQLVPEGSAHAK